MFVLGEFVWRVYARLIDISCPSERTELPPRVISWFVRVSICVILCDLSLITSDVSASCINTSSSSLGLISCKPSIDVRFSLVQVSYLSLKFNDVRGDTRIDYNIKYARFTTISLTLLCLNDKFCCVYFGYFIVYRSDLRLIISNS